MIKPPSQEELLPYFAYFDRIGESSVRVAVNSGRWENDRARLGAAIEWLRQIDESRQIPKRKSWHEKAWGKIIIGVIVGIIVLTITLLTNRYLQKSQLQDQPKNHEKIQKK
jgi:hypothetical protein